MFEVLFALLPMVILIIAMGICKWPGDKSSLLTLVITVMIVYPKVCKSFLFSSLQIYSFLIK